MKRSTRALAVAGSALAAVSGYRYFLSPRIQRWGATADEVLRPMPGDELVPDPMFHATHAITIDAPPDDVWPWLLQIGYGRAGFYSYQRMERMMGLTGILNANRIIHEFQQLKVGDTVPFGPGEEAGLQVVTLEPKRLLCLARRDKAGTMTWAFGLYPIDAQHTRLVSRNRAYMPDWTVPRILIDPSRWRAELPMKLFINLGALVMVRKMLLGIKSRAEGTHVKEVTEERVLALSSGCE